MVVHHILGKLDGLYHALELSGRLFPVDRGAERLWRSLFLVWQVCKLA